MKSEVTAFSVLLCFAFIVTLAQSSPVLDYEHHSLSKREATAQPEAEPESSSSGMTDSSTGASEPEPESSSASPEAEPEAGKNGTSGEKKGFFKTVGENIKNGASSAMEKVKAAAGNVKESVQKAVNNAATKIKDATDKKTTEKPACNATGLGTFSTTPQNIQDVNCTMKASTDMNMSDMASSTGAPQEASGKRKRRENAGTTDLPMPDSSTSNENSGDDNSENRRNSSSSRTQKRSQVDISTNESNEPILVHGPQDTANLRPSIHTEKNISIKDTTVPTLPPLGPYPNVKKPGKCPPLVPGLNCVAMTNDAAQCRSDSSCPGTKKCCYFACQPYNKDVGVCESPVFYKSVSQPSRF